MPVSYVESTDVYSTQSPAPQRFELEVMFQRRAPTAIGDAVSLGEIYVENPMGITELTIAFDGSGAGDEFSRVYLLHILPGSALNTWQSVASRGPIQTPGGNDIELVMRWDGLMVEFAVRRVAGTLTGRIYGSIRHTGLWLAQYKQSIATYSGVGVVAAFSGASVWFNGTTAPAAGTGSSFLFVQPTPLASWVISHALGYRPVSQVFSLAGDVVEADVANPTLLQTVITFAAPMVGSARLV